MTVPASGRLDVTVAQSARRYNYWLGGKDHFQVDRDSGDRIRKAYPNVVVDARANREWMHRVVRFLAGELKVTQFLDVGVGLPVEPNVHEVAQQINPACRVVYLDNDPLVMVHARALLTGTPEGVTAYAELDMHDTGQVLAAARSVLDFRRPVAVLYCAVLHFVDDAQAYDLMARTVGWLPADSVVAISNFTIDGMDPQTRAKIAQVQREHTDDGPIWPRSREQFAKFFDGLELIDPGVCPVSDWRLDLGARGEEARVAHVYGAVARTPGPARFSPG